MYRSRKYAKYGETCKYGRYTLKGRMRIVSPEFAEMHFDEAPSWCGRGMNEGDKKQS